MNYKVSKREYYKTRSNITTNVTILLIAITVLIIFGSIYATIDKIQMAHAADNILSSDNKINNDYQIVNVLFTDRSRNIESDCSDGVDNDNDGLIDQDDTDDCPE